MNMHTALYNNKPVVININYKLVSKLIKDIIYYSSMAKIW